MKTCTVIVAGLAASLFFTTAARASSDVSVSSLQKQVDQAKADLDQAKEKAESGMSSSGKAEWRPAEAKFETMVAQGGNPDKISAQGDTLREIESRLMKSSDRDEVDEARNKLARAGARLNEAKAKLRATQHGDDSSQAIQPENRTQNGANFSIRSERDSENHPPLPASP
jgi:hypothetical protein